MPLYQRAPYGNLWPEADGRMLLSLTLGKTAFTESREFAGLLAQLLARVDAESEVESGTPMQLLAEALVRQGYLRSGSGRPDELEDAEVDLPYVFWRTFDFARFRELEKELGAERLVHVFLGDGDGLAWLYAREAGVHPCLECLIRRWLAKKPVAARNLMAPGRRVRWRPAVEPAKARQAKLEWGSVRILGEATAVPVLAAPVCPDCRSLKLSLRPKARNHALRAPHFGLLESQPVRSPWEDFFLGQASCGVQEWLTGDPGRAADLAGALSSPLARDRAIRRALERYAASADGSCEGRSWFGDKTLSFAPHEVLHKDDQRPPYGVAGLKAGESAAEAFEYGLLDCLEKDALALFWARLLRGDVTAGFHIRLPESLSQQLLGWRLQAFALQLPSLGATVHLVVVRDELGRLACGSACRLIPAQASELALSRAVTAYTQMLEGCPEPSPTPATGAEHRHFYWHYPQLFPWAQMGNLPPAQGSRRKLRDMQGLVKELEGKGHEVFYCDLSTSDLQNLGWTVLRVLAPQWLYVPTHHLAWPVARERWQRLVGNQAPAFPHPFGS